MSKLAIIILTFGFFQITNTFSQETKGNNTNLKNEQFHPMYLQYELDTLKTKTGEIRKINSTSIAPYKVILFLFGERSQDKARP